MSSEEKEKPANNREDVIAALEKRNYRERVKYAGTLASKLDDPGQTLAIVKDLREKNEPPRLPGEIEIDEELSEILPPQERSVGKHIHIHECALLMTASVLSKESKKMKNRKNKASTTMDKSEDDISMDPSSISEPIEDSEERKEAISILEHELLSQSKQFKKFVSRVFCREITDGRVLLDLVIKSPPKVQKLVAHRLIKQQNIPALDKIAEEFRTKAGVDVFIDMLHGCSSKYIKKQLKNGEIFRHNGLRWEKLYKFHQNMIFDMIEKDLTKADVFFGSVNSAWYPWIQRGTDKSKYKYAKKDPKKSPWEQLIKVGTFQSKKIMQLCLEYPEFSKDPQLTDKDSKDLIAPMKTWDECWSEVRYLKQLPSVVNNRIDYFIRREPQLLLEWAKKTTVRNYYGVIVTGFPSRAWNCKKGFSFDGLMMPFLRFVKELSDVGFVTDKQSGNSVLSYYNMYVGRTAELTSIHTLHSLLFTVDSEQLVKSLNYKKQLNKRYQIGYDFRLLYDITKCRGKNSVLETLSPKQVCVLIDFVFEWFSELFDKCLKPLKLINGERTMLEDKHSATMLDSSLKERRNRVEYGLFDHLGFIVLVSTWVHSWLTRLNYKRDKKTGLNRYQSAIDLLIFDKWLPMLLGNDLAMKMSEIAKQTVEITNSDRDVGAANGEVIATQVNELMQNVAQPDHNRILLDNAWRKSFTEQRLKKLQRMHSNVMGLTEYWNLKCKYEGSLEPSATEQRIARKYEVDALAFRLGNTTGDKYAPNYGQSNIDAFESSVYQPFVGSLSSYIRDSVFIDTSQVLKQGSSKASSIRRLWPLKSALNSCVSTITQMIEHEMRACMNFDYFVGFYAMKIVRKLHPSISRSRDRAVRKANLIATSAGAPPPSTSSSSSSSTTTTTNSTKTAGSTAESSATEAESTAPSSSWSWNTGSSSAANGWADYMNQTRSLIMEALFRIFTSKNRRPKSFHLEFGSDHNYVGQRRKPAVWTRFEEANVLKNLYRSMYDSYGVIAMRWPRAFPGFVRLLSNWAAQYTQLAKYICTEAWELGVLGQSTGPSNLRKKPTVCVSENKYLDRFYGWPLNKRLMRLFMPNVFGFLKSLELSLCCPSVTDLSRSAFDVYMHTGEAQSIGTIGLFISGSLNNQNMKKRRISSPNLLAKFKRLLSDRRIIKGKDTLDQTGVISDRVVCELFRIVISNLWKTRPAIKMDGVTGDDSSSLAAGSATVSFTDVLMDGSRPSFDDRLHSQWDFQAYATLKDLYIQCLTLYNTQTTQLDSFMNSRTYLECSEIRNEARIRLNLLTDTVSLIDSQRFITRSYDELIKFWRLRLSQELVPHLAAYKKMFDVVAQWRLWVTELAYSRTDGQSTDASGRSHSIFGGKKGTNRSDTSPLTDMDAHIKNLLKQLIGRLQLLQSDSHHRTLSRAIPDFLDTISEIAYKHSIGGQKTKKMWLSTDKLEIDFDFEKGFTSLDELHSFVLAGVEHEKGNYDEDAVKSSDTAKKSMHKSKGSVHRRVFTDFGEMHALNTNLVCELYNCLRDQYKAYQKYFETTVIVSMREVISTHAFYLMANHDSRRALNRSWESQSLDGDVEMKDDSAVVGSAVEETEMSSDELSKGHCDLVSDVLISRSLNVMYDEIFMSSFKMLKEARISSELSGSHADLAASELAQSLGSPLKIEERAKLIAEGMQGFWNAAQDMLSVMMSNLNSSINSNKNRLIKLKLRLKGLRQYNRQLLNRARLGLLTDEEQAEVLAAQVLRENNPRNLDRGSPATQSNRSPFVEEIVDVINEQNSKLHSAFPDLRDPNTPSVSGVIPFNEERPPHVYLEVLPRNVPELIDHVLCLESNISAKQFALTRCFDALFDLLKQFEFEYVPLSFANKVIDQLIKLLGFAPLRYFQQIFEPLKTLLLNHEELVTESRVQNILNFTVKKQEFCFEGLTPKQLSEKSKGRSYCDAMYTMDTSLMSDETSGDLAWQSVWKFLLDVRSLLNTKFDEICSQLILCPTTTNFQRERIWLTVTAMMPESDLDVTMSDATLTAEAGSADDGDDDDEHGSVQYDREQLIPNFEHLQYMFDNHEGILVSLIQSMLNEPNRVSNYCRRISTAILDHYLEPETLHIPLTTQDKLMRYLDIRVASIRKRLSKMADSASVDEREAAYRHLMSATLLCDDESRGTQVRRTLDFMMKKLKNEAIDRREKGLEIVFGELKDQVKEILNAVTETSQGSTADHKSEDSIKKAPKNVIELLLEMLQDCLEVQDLDNGEINLVWENTTEHRVLRHFMQLSMQCIRYSLAQASCQLANLDSIDADEESDNMDENETGEYLAKKYADPSSWIAPELESSSDISEEMKAKILSRKQSIKESMNVLFEFGIELQWRICVFRKGNLEAAQQFVPLLGLDGRSFGLNQYLSSMKKDPMTFVRMRREFNFVSSQLYFFEEFEEVFLEWLFQSYDKRILKLNPLWRLPNDYGCDLMKLRESKKQELALMEQAVKDAGDASSLASASLIKKQAMDQCVNVIDSAVYLTPLFGILGRNWYKHSCLVTLLQYIIVEFEFMDLTIEFDNEDDQIGQLKPFTLKIENLVSEVLDQIYYHSKEKWVENEDFALFIPACFQAIKRLHCVGYDTKLMKIQNRMVKLLDCWMSSILSTENNRFLYSDEVWDSESKEKSSKVLSVLIPECLAVLNHETYVRKPCMEKGAPQARSDFWWLQLELHKVWRSQLFRSISLDNDFTSVLLLKNETEPWIWKSEEIRQSLERIALANRKKANRQRWNKEHRDERVNVERKLDDYFIPFKWRIFRKYLELCHNNLKVTLNEISDNQSGVELIKDEEIKDMDVEMSGLDVNDDDGKKSLVAMSAKEQASLESMKPELLREKSKMPSLFDIYPDEWADSLQSESALWTVDVFMQLIRGGKWMLLAEQPCSKLLITRPISECDGSFKHGGLLLSLVNVSYKIESRAILKHRWHEVGLVNDVISEMLRLFDLSSNVKYSRDDDGLFVIESNNPVIQFFENLIAKYHCRNSRCIKLSQPYSRLWYDVPILKQYNNDYIMKSRQIRLGLWRWLAWKSAHPRKPNTLSKYHRGLAVKELLEITPSAIHLRFVWRHLVQYDQPLLCEFIESGKPYRGVFYIEPDDRVFTHRQKKEMAAKKSLMDSRMVEAESGALGQKAKAGPSGAKSGVSGKKDRGVKAPKRMLEVTKVAREAAAAEKEKGQESMTVREMVAKEREEQMIFEAAYQEYIEQQQAMDEAGDADYNDLGFDHRDLWRLEGCYQLNRLLPQQLKEIGKRHLAAAMNVDRGMPERVKAMIRWTLLPSTSYADIVEFFDKYTSKSCPKSKRLSINLIETLLKGVMENDEALAPMHYLLQPAFLKSQQARVAAFAIAKSVPYVHRSQYTKLLRAILSGKRRLSLKITAYKQIIRMLVAKPSAAHIRMLVYEWDRDQQHRDVRIVMLTAGLKFISAQKELRHAVDASWHIFETCVTHRDVRKNIEIMAAFMGATTAGNQEIVKSWYDGLTLKPRLTDFLATFSEYPIPRKHCEHWASIVIQLCDRVYTEVPGYDDGKEEDSEMKEDTAHAADDDDDDFDVLDNDNGDVEMKDESKPESKIDEEEQKKETPFDGNYLPNMGQPRCNDDIAFLAMRSLELWLTFIDSSKISPAIRVLAETICDFSVDFVSSKNEQISTVMNKRFNMACKVLAHILKLKLSDFIRTDHLPVITQILQRFVYVLELPNSKFFSDFYGEGQCLNGIDNGNLFSLSDSERTRFESGDKFAQIRKFKSSIYDRMTTFLGYFKSFTNVPMFFDLTTIDYSMDPSSDDADDSAKEPTTKTDFFDSLLKPILESPALSSLLINEVTSRRMDMISSVTSNSDIVGDSSGKGGNEAQTAVVIEKCHEMIRNVLQLAAEDFRFAKSKAEDLIQKLISRSNQFIRTQLLRRMLVDTTHEYDLSRSGTSYEKSPAYRHLRTDIIHSLLKLGYDESVWAVAAEIRDLMVMQVADFADMYSSRALKSGDSVQSDTLSVGSTLILNETSVQESIVDVWVDFIKRYFRSVTQRDSAGRKINSVLNRHTETLMFLDTIVLNKVANIRTRKSLMLSWEDCIWLSIWVGLINKCSDLLVIAYHGRLQEIVTNILLFRDRPVRFDMENPLRKGGFLCSSGLTAFNAIRTLNRALISHLIDFDTLTAALIRKICDWVLNAEKNLNIQVTVTIDPGSKIGLGYYNELLELGLDLIRDHSFKTYFWNSVSKRLSEYFSIVRKAPSIATDFQSIYNLWTSMSRLYIHAQDRPHVRYFITAMVNHARSATEKRIAATQALRREYLGSSSSSSSSSSHFSPFSLSEESKHKDVSSSLSGTLYGERKSYADIEEGTAEDNLFPRIFLRLMNDRPGDLVWYYSRRSSMLSFLKHDPNLQEMLDLLFDLYLCPPTDGLPTPQVSLIISFIRAAQTELSQRSRELPKPVIDMVKPLFMKWLKLDGISDEDKERYTSSADGRSLSLSEPLLDRQLQEKSVIPLPEGSKLNRHRLLRNLCVSMLCTQTSIVCSVLNFSEDVNALVECYLRLYWYHQRNVSSHPNDRIFPVSCSFIDSSSLVSSVFHVMNPRFKSNRDVSEEACHLIQSIMDAAFKYVSPKSAGSEMMLASGLHTKQCASILFNLMSSMPQMLVQMLFLSDERTAVKKNSSSSSSIALLVSWGVEYVLNSNRQLSKRGSRVSETTSSISNELQSIVTYVMSVSSYLSPLFSTQYRMNSEVKKLWQTLVKQGTSMSSADGSSEHMSESDLLSLNDRASFNLLLSLLKDKRYHAWVILACAPDSLSVIYNLLARFVLLQKHCLISNAESIVVQCLSFIRSFDEVTRKMYNVHKRLHYQDSSEEEDDSGDDDGGFLPSLFGEPKSKKRKADSHEIKMDEPLYMNLSDPYDATNFMAPTKRLLTSLFTMPTKGGILLSLKRKGMSESETVFFHDLLMRVVWSSFINDRKRMLHLDNLELFGLFILRTAEFYGNVSMRATGVLTAIIAGFHEVYPTDPDSLTNSATVKFEQVVSKDESEMNSVDNLEAGFALSVARHIHNLYDLRSKFEKNQGVYASHFVDELIARLIFKYGLAYVIQSSKLSHLIEQAAEASSDATAAADGAVAPSPLTGSSKRKKNKKQDAYDCVVWLPVFTALLDRLMDDSQTSPKVKGLCLTIQTSFVDVESHRKYKAAFPGA